MNKQQRKQIEELTLKLQYGLDNGTPLPEFKEVVKDVVSQLESIRDEEQEKYDNLPESLQNSEKGESLTDGIEFLESTIQDLELVDDTEEGEDEEAVGDVVQAAIENLEQLQ